jgi:hypothetical protein
MSSSPLQSIGMYPGYFIPTGTDLHHESIQAGSSHGSQPAHGSPELGFPSLAELAFAMEVDEPEDQVPQLPATDGSSHGSQPAHGSPESGCLSLAELAFVRQVDGSGDRVAQLPATDGSSHRSESSDDWLPVNTFPNTYEEAADGARLMGINSTNRTVS